MRRRGFLKTLVSGLVATLLPGEKHQAAQAVVEPEWDGGEPGFGCYSDAQPMIVCVESPYVVDPIFQAQFQAQYRQELIAAFDQNATLKALLK